MSGPYQQGNHGDSTKITASNSKGDGAIGGVQTEDK